MKISVVVCGYDKYSKGWPIFEYGFNKYWSDCPFKKYFITNFFSAPKGFQTIKTGPEFSWGLKVRSALNQVKSELVIWMMEDYWLPGPIKTKELKEICEAMLKNKNIDHIRLQAPCNSGDDKVIPEIELRGVSNIDRRLWHFKKDAEYRASVTASIWRKEALLSYLRHPMDPWLFEQEASVLSTTRKNLYLCIIDPFIFPFPHFTNPYQTIKDEMCNKGKWKLAAYDYIKKEGLTFDFMMNPDGTLNRDYYEEKLKAGQK